MVLSQCAIMNWSHQNYLLSTASLCTKTVSRGKRFDAKTVCYLRAGRIQCTACCETKTLWLLFKWNRLDWNVLPNVFQDLVRAVTVCTYRSYITGQTWRHSKNTTQRILYNYNEMCPHYACMVGVKCHVPSYDYVHLLSNTLYKRYADMVYTDVLYTDMVYINMVYTDVVWCSVTVLWTETFTLAPFQMKPTGLECFIKCFFQQLVRAVTVCTYRVYITEQKTLK